MMAAQQQAQEALKSERVEASAGGGMVKVVMTGDLHLESIAIDPDAVDPEDVEMLQDMVVAAVNEAVRSAQELQESKLGGLAEGFDPMSALDALGMGGMGGLGGCRGGGGGLPGGQPNRAARAEEALTTSARPAPPAPRHRAGQAPRHRPADRAAARLPHPARLRRGRGALAEAIRDVKEKITLCEVCFNLAEGPRCTVCLDERRDADLICVVEEPGDVIPIERTHEYRGRYHVLGGALSPIDGVEPEDLKLAQLYDRVDERRPRGDPRHQPDDDRRGDRAPRRRRAARARARRRRHPPRVRPPGRRRPRVRRRGHARPRASPAAARSDQPHL